MSTQTEPNIRMIENAKRVWVENQNLRNGAGIEAQVQVKAGRRTLAVYRTDSSEEGFRRCFEYAERFAEAHGLTVSDGEKY